MALEDSSVKDFGGGWNTSDSDQNLNSRFQPISDNIVRGIDGSFGPRQGMGLWCDFATGTATDLGNIAIAIGTVNGTAKVLVDLPVNHGLTGGNHITISGLTADVNGIPFAEINGTHSVVIVDPNSMSFHVRVNATSTATVSRAADIVLDNNLLGGNIIHEQYFSRKLIVFTDIGEIGTAADDGTADRKSVV